MELGQISPRSPGRCVPPAGLAAGGHEETPSPELSGGKRGGSSTRERCRAQCHLPHHLLLPRPPREPQSRSPRLEAQGVDRGPRRLRVWTGAHGGSGCGQGPRAQAFCFCLHWQGQPGPSGPPPQPQGRPWPLKAPSPGAKAGVARDAGQLKRRRCLRSRERAGCSRKVCPETRPLRPWPSR